MLSIAYLKIPTRKTGITSSVFRLERAELTPLTNWDFEGAFISVFKELISSPVGVSGGIAEYGLSENLRGSGMTARIPKHVITDPMAKPQGIQGEISMVTEAIKDATSSAT